MQQQFADLNVVMDLDEVEHDESEPDTVAIWDINWGSLTAFLACTTQWRVLVGAEKLVWLGLDYAGVDVVLRRLRSGKGVFADLQAMEAAALEAFGESAE